MAELDVKTEFRNLAAELKEVIAKNDGKVEGMNAELKSQYDKINERMDAIEFEMKSRPATPSAEGLDNEIISDFKGAFHEFANGNRQQLAQKEVKSSMYPQTKSNTMVRFDFASAGALLAPDQLSTEIIKDVVEYTPVMQLVRVTQTNRSNYTRTVRTSTPGGNWLEEVGSNPKRKLSYAQVDIPPHKWAARYAWSIEQQQDSGYDLIGEIMQAYREDFRADVGNKLLVGDGIKKPFGMVGRIENFNATQLAISTDDLIRMQEALKEEYQANASWLFTRQTRAYIRTKVLSATNGLQYTWEPNFQRSSPTLLLGAPVFIAAEGDLAGRVEGNFTAGQVYAIYGDFRQGYEVAMHTDMYIIDDSYSEADSFTRNFHIMSRVGGNVIQKEALVQITAAGS